MEFVTYEQDGFVGVITINRPKALKNWMQHSKLLI